MDYKEADAAREFTWDVQRGYYGTQKSEPQGL